MKNIKLRPWQQEAFNALKNEQYRIINALTGSGKSHLMLHMAISEAIEGDRKSVICIPQEIISASFGDNTPHAFGDTIITNVPGRILNSFEFANKQKAFHDFKKSNKDIFLCSYQTFITAYRNNSEMFNDMEIYVDETHHIKAYESDEFSNQMGSIIYSLVENGKTHITLSSATIFRGDKLDVIEDSIKEKFVRFNLNVDEYLKNMKYIKGIQIDVKTYDITNPFEEIKKAYNPDKKIIIYAPYVNSQEFKVVGNKKRWINGFVAALGRSNPKVTEPDSNGILTVKNNRIIKILDLITDEKVHRASAKKYLIENQKSNDAIDVILALGMMKEGANFVAASEAHVFGVRNIKETLQILGRALRDYKGKSIARIVLYVPKSLEFSNEQFKSDTENYVKASLLSMIVEDVIYSDTSLRSKTPASSKAWDDFGSEKKIDLLTKSTKSLMNVDEELPSNEYISNIYNVVEENTQGLSDEEKEFISNKIFDIHIKNTIKTNNNFNGINITDVDYSVIREEIKHPMGWITLSTKNFGVNNFSELRTAYGTVKFSGTPEELKKEAEKYGITNACQWTKQYNDHPEWKGVYPQYPNNIKEWENTFPKVNTDFTGTPEGMKLEAEKYGITNAGQWKNQYKNHPEWKGVYPKTLYHSKGWENVFQKAILYTLTGTPEELKKEAEKYGITNAYQWLKQYNNHPEWFGVYPKVLGIKGWENTLQKARFCGNCDNSSEEMKKEAKKYGITNESQWVKQYDNHPEWFGVYPKYSSSTKGWENVFQKKIKTFTGTPEELKKEAKKYGITTSCQWRRTYDNHPEWLGVYPKFLFSLEKWSNVFQKKIKTFTGTPEGMKKEAEKYGITNACQWTKQYNDHPEWKGVYPKCYRANVKFKHIL